VFVAVRCLLRRLLSNLKGNARAGPPPRPRPSLYRSVILAVGGDCCVPIMLLLQFGNIKYPIFTLKRHHDFGSTLCCLHGIIKVTTPRAEYDLKLPVPGPCTGRESTE
jgi:hypothetical protein